ncbi:hypothetical protein BGZ95_003339, partial [Linnemannia exigua]
VSIDTPEVTEQGVLLADPKSTYCAFPFRYLQGGINNLKFEFEEYDFSTIPGGINFLANFEKLKSFIQSSVESNMLIPAKENFANYTATLLAFKRGFRDLRKYVDVKEAVRGVIDGILTLERYTFEYKMCIENG